MIGSAALALALMCAAFDQQPGAWTALLQQYVHAGEVDYAHLRQDPGKLDAYLGQLARL